MRIKGRPGCPHDAADGSTGVGTSRRRREIVSTTLLDAYAASPPTLLDEDVPA